MHFSEENQVFSKIWRKKRRIFKHSSNEREIQGIPATVRRHRGKAVCFSVDEDWGALPEPYSTGHKIHSRRPCVFGDGLAQVVF